MGLPRPVFPGRVYMVTRRCLERHFFLRPDRDMTQAFAYCLAAASRRTNVRVICSSVQANHHHTIVLDVDGRLPEFLEHLHKFVAKCGNALRGRWESFWSPEQASCVHLVEPDDILDKMVYAITNPVKDHRVEKVAHWPGLDCLTAIEQDVPIVADRPRHFFRDNTSLPQVETLTFVRPPGFEHLSHDAWAALLCSRVTQVEQDAERERRLTGWQVMGAKAVLRQHWDDSPTSREPRRVLSPRVAARSKWARVEALARNKAFIDAYRVARDAFLAGVAAFFPAGTYWLRRFAGVVCEGDGAAVPAPAPA